MFQRYLTTGKKPDQMIEKKLRLYHKELSKKIKARETVLEIEGMCQLNTIYCSTTPLNNLKRIAITDLRANVPLKGYYLILRNLEEPYRYKGILTVVEDHEGNVLGFNVHNLVSPKFEETPDDVLPVGTVFILKEPLLLDNYTIRCNSPSDFIIISEHHELYNMIKDIRWKNKIVSHGTSLPSTSDGWKCKGNEYFKKERYILALDAYLMAIHLIKRHETQLEITLHSNLSATYLNLQYYEKALEYALKTLAADPDNTKALYRAGRSHYLLRQFSDSEQFFRKLIAVDKANKEGKRHLELCEIRLKESREGCAVSDLYQASVMCPRTKIDCADYIGPLKINTSLENDRTVVATKDIIPGTLLVVSKALVAQYQDEFISDTFFNYGVTEKAIRELTQLVVKNPTTIGTAVYDLPINDGFQNRITPKLFCDESSKKEPIADVGRLRQIIFSNGVAIDSPVSSIGLLNDTALNCAFFLYPSYFTHSCMANASWIIHNDVMVIHANQNIREGSVVSISYINPLTYFSDKDNYFLNREMKCLCAFCERDRAEPDGLRKKREVLTLELEETFIDFVRTRGITKDYLNFISASTKRIEDLFKASGRSELMFGLACAYTPLAMSHSHNDWVTSDVLLHTEKGLKYVWKALSALGFDKNSIRSWSKGPEQFSVPSNALFFKMTLDLVALLVSFHEVLGMRSEATFYLKCLFVGNGILFGANPIMTLKTFTTIPRNLDFLTMINTFL